jgi:opacity protein-like surface antigen
MARFTSALSGARAVLLAAAILALSASQAIAQYGEKKVELTPFGGWYIASDLYTASSAQIGINNSVVYGARLGVFPNPKFGIEGSYSRASSDLEIVNSSATFPSSTPLGSLTVDEWDGNLVFTAQKSPKATSFFTLGAGATTFSVDANGVSESKTQFAWNFGIGTKISMSEKVALRLDGRFRSTETDINTSSGVYCDPFYCYEYSSSWYSSGEISAGLAYRLK